MQTIKKNDILNIPIRLKTWRQKYNITLQQLANFFKITHAAISYWESGSNQMKHKHLLKILELIESPPPEELLNLTSPPVAMPPVEVEVTTTSKG